MENISYTDEQLIAASKRGETQAARALSVLAKRQVNVQTKEAKVVADLVALDTVNNIEGHAVIAYVRVLTGLAGVSLLSMDRKDALDLVDLFNNRPIGTTVAMQELDRSTIRETLNILGNAYATELANEIGKTVLLSVPSMITKDRLETVLKNAGVTEAKKAALFETELKVEEVDYKVQLFFFFVAGQPE